MSNMYDNITGRAPIATDDLGYIGTGNKASDILSSVGTSDYNELTNKPTINNVVLKGNKTSSDLGLQPTIDSTHKLSPDNISFTETQTNSINSGITAALTGQITTNQNNILSRAKLYTVSQGSDGAVSNATFDWSQLVSGAYLITCINVIGPQVTDRYGVSVYSFYKFGDGSIGLWTPISDIANAKISSYAVSDDTLTLTYDVLGYHNTTIVNLNILTNQ